MLRKIACPFRNKECEMCPVRENCVYSYIFLTPQSDKVKTIYKYKDYPHPYLIEPPLNRQLEKETGATLSFNLLAFEELGKIGEFFPYIKLGEYIHIGKNTTFGLGRYKVDI